MAFFESLVPEDPAVEVRPMFGNVAAFVNRNMFLSVFGNQVAVRLDEEDRGELLAEDGAVPFEPMEGRPMKEYVVLPAAWHGDVAKLASWFDRSAMWTRTLPPKTKKPPKRK